MQRMLNKGFTRFKQSVLEYAKIEQAKEKALLAGCIDSCFVREFKPPTTMATATKNVTQKVNSRLFHVVHFVKCWQMFLELNSKGLYQVQEKKKKVVFLSSRPRQCEVLALSRCSRTTTAKKCTKEAWCTCKVVVLLFLSPSFELPNVNITKCPQYLKYAWLLTHQYLLIPPKP